MKKALAMALGAVLVAGSAAPASAASMVDFKGFYGTRYSVNGNLGFTNDGSNVDDRFFEHRFQVQATFQATDEISVVWRLRGPNGNRWGTEGSRSNLDTRAIYGQIVQDWGTVRVGRLLPGLGDQFGLSTLGYTPSLDADNTFISPFEAANYYDSIQYSNEWDNGFGLNVTYSKVTDMYGRLGLGANDNVSNDHDADRYQAEGYYRWDGGGAALNVYYLRDATGDGAPAPAPYVLTHGSIDKTNSWFINPAIMHSWGAFSAHFEGMVGWGTTSFYDDPGLILAGVRTPNRDSDASGQGFYLDVDYNYGPGRVNLATWWVSGTDLAPVNAAPNRNPENKALVDLVGGNFYPLVVAYGPVNTYYAGPVADPRVGAVGAVGAANNFRTYAATNNRILPNALGVAAGAAPASLFAGERRTDGNFTNGNANHWALMVSGQHAFTDAITFNYALAYLALNNPNYTLTQSARFDNAAATYQNHVYQEQDTDLGFEIDFGVNVQLLDNLLFTSTFGYMFAGDAYKTLNGYAVTNADATGHNVQAQWKDGEDSYTWVNSLVFSF